MTKTNYLLLLLLFACGNLFAQKNVSVTISIPKDEGLTSVNYIAFKITDSLLYVFENGDTNIVTPKSKVLAVIPIGPVFIKQLDSAVAKLDTLKRFVNRCAGSLTGWPRFYIFCEKNGKTAAGFIANIYRKDIFSIIDIFNEAYPKGDIISYDKQALLQKEKDCKATAKRK